MKKSKDNLKKFPSPRQIKRNLEKTQEEQERLLKEEKTPKELLRKINGTVTRVTNYNQPTYLHQNGELIGPNSNSYSIRTGDVSKLEIIMEGADPVKTIQFNGYSPIKGGDKINAYVVKSKKVQLPMPIFNNNPYSRNIFSKKSVLVEGELKKNMQCYKIEILQDKKIIRIDRAIDYPN